MERLSGLPELKRQFDAANPGAGLGSSELKAFLDKLDQQVTKELDRRALIDAQQYLEQMTKQGSPERGENYARSEATGEPDPNAAGLHEKSFSKLPGKEPGNRMQTSARCPTSVPARKLRSKEYSAPEKAAV
jgi:hypothetical protein